MVFALLILDREEEEEEEVVVFEGVFEEEGVEGSLGMGGTDWAVGEIWERGFGAIVCLGLGVGVEGRDLG